MLQGKSLLNTLLCQLITVIVILPMVLLSGCNGSNSNSPTPEKQSTGQEQQSEDIPDQLKSIEENIEKIFKKLGGPSVGVKDQKEEEDAQKEEENKEENQFIYYLAVSPEHFEIIINNLKEYGLEKINNLNPRLVIEKPFGKNLKTAKLLNEKIVSVFGEENTYRIDHYLGKEMLQNIMVIRFSNQFFEPVWNNKYIKRVIINSMETIGVGSRGNYFENFGIIRDMVQSHLLQLLSLIAMEKPKSLNTNDVRDEKIKVLKALKPFTKLDFENNIIRGQYKSYRNEANINPNSTTETFVAFKTYLKNKRWNDVPFIIRTGKKLSRKSTEIIIEFKDIENNLYKEAMPNVLVFKIQPEEGVFLSFNAKKIGTINDLVPVKMDFCQNCEVGFNSPEAYERLLFDVMRGDATLFARWDEVEYSWKFIDKIIDYWQSENPPLHIYEDNSFGPLAADKLVNYSKIIENIYK